MGRYDQHRGKRSGRYQSGTETTPPFTGLPILIIILLILLAGFGGFLARPYIDKLTHAAKPDVRALAIPAPPENRSGLGAEPAPVTQPAADIKTLPAVEEWFVLPELENSDEPLRTAITQAAPSLAPYLNTGQLLKTYLTLANDFSQGIRPAKHLRFLKLEQPFTVLENTGGLVIDTDSYRRYDALAEAVSAVDTSALLAVYKKFRPLFVKVFEEFGYPRGYSPEGMLTKAALQIMSAPIQEQPIALAQRANYYQFADAQLEALNPVHKQMLRMGAKNTRLIQEKTRLFVEGLADITD